MIKLYKIPLLWCIVLGSDAFIKDCPAPSPICRNCNFQYVVVSGCRTCECKNPCMVDTCMDGYYCVPSPDGSANCCPNVISSNCQYGSYNDLDNNGCCTRNCCPAPTCINNCTSGISASVIGSNGCLSYICCPNIVCPSCPSGTTYNSLNVNGCPTCKCCPVQVCPRCQFGFQITLDSRGCCICECA